MSATSIEWTDRTWNPVRGCARVSPGCENCYAERMAHRFSGKGQPYEGLTVLGKHGPRWAGSARFVPEMLGAPLKWRKPQRVFVNSMSDLFHYDITNEQIAAVFGVMAVCTQHTFQVLTKRPDRVSKWFDWLQEPHRDFTDFVRKEPEELCVQRYAHSVLGDKFPLHAIKKTYSRYPWPLPNVWLGVSCEDQKRADERIPLLLRVPAAVRFVSAEPLLGAIDLDADWLLPRCKACGRHSQRDKCCEYEPDCTGGTEHSAQEQVALLDWVIVGGESGPSARPMEVEWAQSIRRQCQEAGVACFVKQLGSAPLAYDSEHEWFDGKDFHTGGLARLRLYDRKGGDMREWPVSLRVREFPR